MSTLKKLAGQTMVYGASSIIGRILNYFLTPILVYVYTVVEYGENIEMYSYVTFFIVLLTYGMETAFFRFSSTENDKEKVYNTALTSLAVTSTLFIVICLLFSGSLANLIGYASRPDFIIYFGLILGIDAFTAIPMAKLRQENKAKKFALINLASIGTNILFIVVFVWYGKYYYDQGKPNFISDILYTPSIGIAYVFIANLLASLVKLACLYKEVLAIRFAFDMALLKKMLIYSSPLLVAGFAGMVNETIDRILLRRILQASHGITYAKVQVGIYGGVYKLSIFITLFIQAFRYAAEPFFFSKEKDKDAKKTYSLVMNYFVLAVSIMFLGIMLYIDIFKWFLPNENYWLALKIVPILLVANICLGIYYNQSIWYKLSGQTKYGAYIAVLGASITIVFNLIFIPHFGYVAAAWITLLAYASMMVTSYFLGKKHYPIPYNIRKVTLFFGLALLVFFISKFIGWFVEDSVLITICINTFLLGIYIGFIYLLEKPNFKGLMGKY